MRAWESRAAFPRQGASINFRPGRCYVGLEFVQVAAFDECALIVVADEGRHLAQVDEPVDLPGLQAGLGRDFATASSTGIVSADNGIGTLRRLSPLFTSVST
jgi:hypothetical protein